MPSPFPGMDPCLEDQVWPEFHQNLISAIQAALIPALRPRYIARIDERVYLQYEAEETPRLALPDVTVLRETGRAQQQSAPAGTIAIADPIIIPLPMPEEIKESFIEIQIRETHEVVTIIEVLSPANKSAGGKGREEYLHKREAVRLSRAHLLEIDLLRGGTRLPTKKPLPSCDYLALLSRARRRSAAEVWPFTLRERLPVIPIPLAGADPDVPLDLQGVFNRVYDQTGYNYSIDYGASIQIPPEDAGWLEDVLRKPEEGQ